MTPPTGLARSFGNPFSERAIERRADSFFVDGSMTRQCNVTPFRFRLNTHTRENRRQKGALFASLPIGEGATTSSLGRAEVTPRGVAGGDRDRGWVPRGGRQAPGGDFLLERWGVRAAAGDFEARRIRRRVGRTPLEETFLAARVTREDVGHIGGLGGRFRLPESRAGPPRDRVHLAGVRVLLERRSGGVSRRREARGVVARDKRRPIREREKARWVAGVVSPSRRRARDARRVGR